MRVLIVEDDPLLGEALATGLRQRGFAPDWVQDGREAQTAMRVEPFAAIVLDLGLPGLTGLELLRGERARGNKVPVLILTARDAVQDRITGLDGGADDYVVKPTDLNELAARLRALVRRSKGEPAPVLRAGNVRVDPAARAVTVDGRAIELQPREFALLQELMLNAGRVLSREQLEERVYRWGEEVESNAVEVHVHHLRRKIGSNVVKATEDEIETGHAPVLHRYRRRVMFQVWEDGEVLRLHSQNAPNTPLSRARQGFSETTLVGSRWRVFSTWNARDRVLVQVAEQFNERDELATAVARNFVLPLVITLPVLGAVIWIAVGRALRTVTDVNQQVASRAADSVSPIDVADAPAEIGALVTNLNSLFARVQHLIEQERQFTGDAAHELRTPLAAVRAQAQVAQRATGDAERIRALNGVIAGCDRATHTVDQMLTLARLEPDAVSFHPAPVDLGVTLKESIGELAPAALARTMDVGLTDGSGLTVSGDAGLLAVLFRNLVDNAIRYSPPGTTVDVAVEATASHARVTVTDAGPGIPADQRASVVAASIARRGRWRPGVDWACRLCSESSICIAAR